MKTIFVTIGNRGIDQGFRFGPHLAVETINISFLRVNCSSTSDSSASGSMCAPVPVVAKLPPLTSSDTVAEIYVNVYWTLLLQSLRSDDKFLSTDCNLSARTSHSTPCSMSHPLCTETHRQTQPIMGELRKWFSFEIIFIRYLS